VKFHPEYSYVHHPELIDLTPLDSVFKLIQATVPKEYDTLEKAIEITNDVNRDMDLGEPVVTEDGILGDDEAQCQAVINRLCVEIDMKLDMLSYLKGVIVPDRNIQHPNYKRVFDQTTKRIYEVITGRGCPESVKVM
jgi:hypothetical protein